jgi:hypothetical protein
MPQLQLPFFPAGMTLINANVGFHLEEGTITYYVNKTTSSAGVSLIGFAGQA